MNEMKKEIIQIKDININDQMGFTKCFISNLKKSDLLVFNNLNNK